MTSFDGVEVFVTAVRTRSFTGAAERLGISKSAVGKSVTRLENRLNVRLFYRTTRKLSLTADGEAFYRACSLAFDEIAHAEGALAAAEATPMGRLRIDMPAAFGRRILLPVLLDIVRPHPALKLDLSFGDRIIDPVEEAVDLVVRFGDPPDQAGLVMRKLIEQRLCICASPAYLATHAAPLTPADLDQHRCILNTRRIRPFYWHIVDAAPERITPPATHEAGDGDAIIALALAGFGLCQMPLCLVSRYLETGALTSVLDAYAQALVPVNLMWPQTRHLVPRVRYIVDELVKAAARGDLNKERPLQKS